jgi:hypothetical protein
MTNEQQAMQLAASGWEIPPYAQTSLWLEGQSGCLHTEGEQGRFLCDAPLPELILRWGGADGAILAQFPWQTPSLDWGGRVSAGGFIDALHITSIPGLDFAIVVLFLVGQPLKPNVAPYPSRVMRAKTPYTTPEFFDGLVGDAPETLTTWLVSEESSLASLAQDALSNNHRLYFWGSLAEETGGWHRHFALPLLLESVTVFAP